MMIVDLAGSECVARSGVSGVGLRESQNINRSLAALGDVLTALAARRPHVPYRNSKLTHFLAPALGKKRAQVSNVAGGDAKTVLLITVQPSSKFSRESSHSLAFGSAARHVSKIPRPKKTSSRSTT